MPLTLATTRPGDPEIFASVQGEGPSAGSPCVFIRLSRCNLACVWCDTAYTWHFEDDQRPHRSGEVFERKPNQVTLQPDDAAARIAEHELSRLVITGGEPLMQGAALAQMLQHLPGMAVEVETNGSVAPHPALDSHISQYNVSPKLAHSGNDAELALIPERLEAWAADDRAWFKFVIADESDVDEVLDLQADFGIPTRRIFLMPEGTDSETLHARAKWLAPLCVDYGFRFTDRLHIHIFGDTRGT